jgi:IS5 family transposase
MAHRDRPEGRALGRPKNDLELVAAEKRQFIDDQRQRNAVEGKTGQGNRRYGMGLMREKLFASQGSPMAINVLVINLQKLLALLFVLVAYWLQLLIDDEAEKMPQTLHAGSQVSPA